MNKPKNTFLLSVPSEIYAEMERLIPRETSRNSFIVDLISREITARAIRLAPVKEYTEMQHEVGQQIIAEYFQNFADGDWDRVQLLAELHNYAKIYAPAKEAADKFEAENPV